MVSLNKSLMSELQGDESKTTFYCNENKNYWKVGVSPVSASSNIPTTILSYLRK